MQRDIGMCQSTVVQNPFSATLLAGITCNEKHED